MRCSLVGVLFLLAMLFLSGCAAQESMKAGDAAALAGRYTDAANHYQRALEADPDLSRDPDFAARFKELRLEAALSEARKFAAGGEFEKASARYQAALEIAPGLTEARVELQQVQVKAAEKRLARALELADKDQLPQAATELSRGRELDEANGHIAAALASLEAGYASAGAEAYAQAVRETEAGRLPEALEAMNAATAADPLHLLARASRLRLQNAMRQGEQYTQQGRQLLSERKLDHAIAALEQAQALWSNHSQAGALLQSAREQLAQAQAFLETAQGHLAQGAWDSARASLAQALALYPDFPAGIAAREALAQRAAEDFITQGDAHRDAGRWTEAEAAYRRAGEYQPQERRLPQRYAALWAARGAQAEAAGLPGQALLFYLQARRHGDDPQTRAKPEELRKAIAQKIPITLGIVVQDGAGGVSEDSLAVEKVLLPTMRQKAPRLEFVSLLAGDAEATAASGAMYQAVVQVAGVRVGENLIRTEDLVHAYTIEQDAPNPELPALAQKLRQEEMELAHMRAEFNRFCPHCHGAGTRLCERCRGMVTMSCSACNGTGQAPAGGSIRRESVAEDHAKSMQVAPARCGACNGSGRVDCPDCKKGRMTCHACQGRGRLSRFTDHDLRQQEAEVNQLRHQLEHTPATVRVQIPASWPYKVQHWARTARLSMKLIVKETAGGRGLHAEVIEKRLEETDAVTVGARPELGLAQDPLLLPTEESLRQNVMLQGSAHAAARVYEAAVTARAEVLLAEARSATPPTEAREQKVAAAVILETTDPVRAERLYQEMMGK